jgi:hypothetical protein
MWEKSEIPTLMNVTHTIELIVHDGEDIKDHRVISKMNFSGEGTPDVHVFKGLLILTWLDSIAGNVIKTFDGTTWSEEIYLNSIDEKYFYKHSAYDGTPIIFEDEYYFFWTEKSTSEIYYVVFNGEMWTDTMTVNAKIDDWNTPIVDRREPFPPLFLPTPFIINDSIFLLTGTYDRFIPISFNGENWMTEEELIIEVEVYRSRAISFQDEICLISQKIDPTDVLYKNGGVFLNRFNGRNWTEQLVLSNGLENISFSIDVHQPAYCQIIEYELVILWRAFLIADSNYEGQFCYLHSNIWDGENIQDFTEVNFSHPPKITILDDTLYLVDYSGDSLSCFTNGTWFDLKLNRTMGYEVLSFSNYQDKLVIFKKNPDYDFELFLINIDQMDYSYYYLNTVLDDEEYEDQYL